MEKNIKKNVVVKKIKRPTQSRENKRKKNIESKIRKKIKK
jgi:hypothetical protein